MRQVHDVLPTDTDETPAPRPAVAQTLTPIKVALAVAGVIALAVLARTAVDVFLLLVLVALVGVLRRTAGDWLGDMLGVRSGTVVFAMAIGLSGWWLAGTDGGRATIGRIFTEAGRLGFGSVLKDRVVVPPSARGPASHGSAGPMVQPSPGATAGGGSTSAPARSAEPRATSGGSNAPEGPVTPTRMTLQARNVTADRVVLQATVSSSGGSPGGRVEFSINGRVVSTARIGLNGSAEATVSVARPGSYRVRARFAGDDRFGPAVAETAFSL